MEGYEVVTVDDQKVGKVVGESGEYLIIEQGTIRKSQHALPREFTHVDESEKLVRMTVPKEIFCDSPKVNGEADYSAIAAHYGIADAGSGDPSRPAEEQGARAGVTSSTEERAQMREGRSDDGLPSESPALLGDRLAGTDRES